MRVRVLKQFPYSENGRHTVILRPSDDPEDHVEVRDDLAAGLSAEGFIDGAEHGLPLLSAGRRASMIDKILELGRRHFERLSDERLLAEFEHAERYAAQPDEDEDDQSPSLEDLRAAVAQMRGIDATDAPVDFLHGSSVLPAIIDVGGRQVQLGGLVVAAARMSGHSTETWNALSEGDREAHLAKALEVLRADPALAAQEIDPSSILLAENKDAGASPEVGQPVQIDGRVEIPTDWEGLHHVKLIAIAKALGVQAQNKAEAVDVIRAEVAKRAGD
jgi:hypothetical protein